MENIPPEALLFQAGYLTVGSVRRIPGLMQISLRYPHLEVRSRLNAVLLQSLTTNSALCGEHATRLYDLLLAQGFAASKPCFTPSTPASRMADTAKTSWPTLSVTKPTSFTATLPRWA